MHHGWVDRRLHDRVAAGNSPGLMVSGAKAGVVLNCAGVGYEIQLTPLQGRLVNGETVEPGSTTRNGRMPAFFMVCRQERAGVIPSADHVVGSALVDLALLQDCGFGELIRAITAGDLRRLSKARGLVNGRQSASPLNCHLVERTG